MMRKTEQKGVTIYLAMLIMSSALATALFVSSVFMREFRIVREVADSARAVYIADSAMEYSLYQGRIAKSLGNSAIESSLAFPGSCGMAVVPTVSGAVCNVLVIPAAPLGTIPGCSVTPDCTATDCMYITSKGSYGSVNRAFEIVFPNC